MATEGKFIKGTSCNGCPLRPLQVFRSFKADELAFVNHLKLGELAFGSGAAVFLEGEECEHLFTVLSGWGFRYKTLDDGRRQILNYVMPGDLIGLQGSLTGEMQHSIEALSPIRVCVFPRSKLSELYREYPELAYDLTWIAAREERMLDENLLSIGRRSALERAAYLIALLYQRATTLELFSGGWGSIPLTQQHVADTLGLSIVHTNKTLRKLADRGLIRWAEKGCDVRDIDGLLTLAGWDGLSEPKRPFI
ncbi:Crp/Fnr family transcriptional regulator [Ensifer aridi]|uniref:Crp/Fnr family transcriptional regulator n=1 Tax=Ensifer aridi TaxID=1708715 RepID=UPI000413F784|nr:Crp/Fnr family transcriptional regulator [Ensifer aridi]